MDKTHWMILLAVLLPVGVVAIGALIEALFHMKWKV